MVFKKWIPIDGTSETFYLEALYHDYEGFRLLLRSDLNQRMLRITFDPHLSYRNTDEGDLLETLQQLPGDSAFYTVSNSNYLEWFAKESCGVYESGNIVHYAIYTPNDCVDVLSICPPKVEWLN